MSIIPPIINRINSSRLRQIDNFRRKPEEVQEGILKNLIKSAVSTEWGIDHNYRAISTVTDYRKNVGLSSYEDIVPWVDRIRGGERDVLWPGEVKWFAKSSGTTNTKSKFIPVTKESLEDCHYRGARDVLAIYTDNNRETGIYKGKSLILGGSHRINSFSNNSLYGDLSAILIENAPYWVNLLRTPKPEIALLEDFEEKLARITEITVKENITNLSGVPSWYLVLLKQIMQYTGKSDLHEVWPNLEVFFHGGISFAPYKEQFRHFIRGENMKYMETYNASEGFFGLQDDLSSPDMLLMLDLGIFYEFIPADQVFSQNPQTLTIGEVEKGKSYALVISTNGGLWRYVIGDTVQFTSLCPHKFVITGRTRHFINAFGEEVIIDNAEKALEAACLATGAQVKEYTAGPVFTGAATKGSHEWLIEFEKLPSDLSLFTETLDKALMSVNSDYEAKRYKDLNLVIPVVRAMPDGTFYKWMKMKNKLGGQNKVPRLSNNREIIQEIYTIAGL